MKAAQHKPGNLDLYKFLFIFVTASSSSLILNSFRRPTPPGKHFFQRPRRNLTSEQSTNSFYFSQFPLYVFIFLSFIFRSENVNFHYKIPQYYGLMITHNDLNRSISFHHVYVFVFVFVFVCFSLQTSCINCTHSQ